jgi:hypothetical protein
MRGRRELGGEALVTDQGPEPVLDLYKLAVEMADRVSARRSTANTFFLTAQTALVAVIGLATPSLLKASWWTALAVSLAGVTLSASWWLQLRSYRDLNGAKFSVINAIEKDLPVKVFSDEWAALNKRSGTLLSSRYMQLGTTERIIPGIFALLYVLLFLGRLIR